MTCDDCKTGIHVKNFRGKIQNERMFSLQAAIDQLLEEHTLNLIVDGLANGDFCANIGKLRMIRIGGKRKPISSF